MIAPGLIGNDPKKQKEIDYLMIKLDDTANGRISSGQLRQYKRFDRGGIKNEYQAGTFGKD